MEAAAHHEYAKIWTVNAGMGILATVAFGLRGLARWKMRAPYKYDDWFCLLALLLMWVDFGCIIAEYHPRLWSVSVIELSLEDQSTLKLFLFITIFSVPACEFATRMSVIFLYYRIFSVEMWLGRFLKATAILNVAWLVGLVLAGIFQCNPIAAAVDPSIKDAKCVNVPLGFLVTEATSLLLDLAVAVLPIHTILGLRMPVREKISVIVIFLTGGFVMITQIVRMVVFGYNPDPKADRSITSLASLAVWTGLHLGFAIICACMPLFRVYLPKRIKSGNTMPSSRDGRRAISPYRSGFPGVANSLNPCGHVARNVFPDRTSQIELIEFELGKASPNDLGQFHRAM